MEYIRIEYCDKTKEIKAFNNTKDLGKWVADNMNQIIYLKPEDMSKKIKINTTDGKEIVRPIDENLGVLENLANMVDSVKLEEERISKITILEPRVGVFK